MSYYDELLLASNDAQRVGWRDPLEQIFRFEIAYRVLGPGSVVDVGCGLGALAGYLRERGFEGTYLGIDLRKTFVDEAAATWDEDFGVADLRTFASKFDNLVAVGAGVGDSAVTPLEELRRCAQRCSADGVYLVSIQNHLWDPALESSALEEPLLRPLRTEALFVDREDARPPDLENVFDFVCSRTSSSPGERARLARNAGLPERARRICADNPDDPLCQLTLEAMQLSSE